MYRPLLCLMLAAAAAGGCRALGYTNLVLHRVGAPDGRHAAVCQQTGALDGPGFSVRVESADGRTRRPVLEMGDGGGCDELRWSADSRLLGVLTAHTATVTVIDVEWALAHPEEQNRHWFTRQFSFSSPENWRRAAGLRFTSGSEVAVDVCAYSLAETQRRAGVISCAGPTRVEHVRVPQPLVGNRPS